MRRAAAALAALLRRRPDPGPPLPILTGDELVRAVACAPCGIGKGDCTCTAWCGRLRCTGPRRTRVQPEDSQQASVTG